MTRDRKFQVGFSAAVVLTVAATVLAVLIIVLGPSGA